MDRQMHPSALVFAPYSHHTMLMPRSRRSRLPSCHRHMLQARRPCHHRSKLDWLQIRAPIRTGQIQMSLDPHLSGRRRHRHVSDLQWLQILARLLRRIRRHYVVLMMQLLQ